MLYPNWHHKIFSDWSRRCLFPLRGNENPRDFMITRSTSSSCSVGNHNTNWSHKMCSFSVFNHREKICRRQAFKSRFWSPCCRFSFPFSFRWQSPVATEKRPNHVNLLQSLYDTHECHSWNNCCKPVARARRFWGRSSMKETRHVSSVRKL